MVDSFNLILPYLVLISHIVFVILILTIIVETSWGNKIKSFIGNHVIVILFLITLMAAIGSLFYSEIIGFEPCVLCWWQRVFIFPMPILLGLALWRNDKYVINYVIPLAMLAGIIALYQSYVYLGGSSLLPCTAVGGACSRIYVKAFGYITIPFMSLTISLYILLITWIHKKYDKNRHA